MLNSSSRRHDPEELVENLLGLVRQLSSVEPSSSVRAHLSSLASQRLRQSTGKVPWASGPKRWPTVWLGPILATVMLMLLLAAASIVGHVRQTVTNHNDGAMTTSRSEPSLGHEKTVVVPNSSVQKRPTKPHRRVVTASAHVVPEQFVVELPYSNNAIANGTSVTIRVAMSRSELLGLGFPVSEAVQDRRVVAELSLGDDGLPRAISLSLPLEFVKEEK